MPPLELTVLQDIMNREQYSYTYDYFVETGTCTGETIMSIEPYFEKLYTIEINKKLSDIASSEYAKKNGDKINFIIGDSSEELKNIMPNLDKNTIFFLDAHFSGGETGKGLKDCPLIEEIENINTLFRHRAVIIIDDCRLLDTCINEDWTGITKGLMIKILADRINQFYYIPSYIDKHDRMIIYIDCIKEEIVNNDYKEYVKYTKNCINDENKFKSFKTNSIYKTILEHTNIEQGSAYFMKAAENDLLKDADTPTATNTLDEIIMLNDKVQKIIEFCSLNDKVGNGVDSEEKTNENLILYKYNFGTNTNESDESNEASFMCSNSSLRYVSHALDILQYIKKINRHVNIVEIGAGYGGLCLSIHHYSKLLGLSHFIGNYSTIDLDGPYQLQKKYLECHGIQINSYNCNNFGSEINEGHKEGEGKVPNLLIANYSLAEIDEELIHKYIKTLIVPKIKYGFVIWNSETLNYGRDLVNHIKVVNFSIEDENPQTSPLGINKQIYFELE